MHRLACLWVGLALFACGGGSSSDVDGGIDAMVIDAPAIDAPAIDSGTDDGGGSDAGERCPSCEGSVVVAMQSSSPPGFRVECPVGEVVDFAGTREWIGPGSDLITNACAEEGDFEPTFYVCCEPDTTDAGVADAGALESGDVCDPAASRCGTGLACCYPCGIPDCDYRCEPLCAPGDPACVDGCLLRP